MSVVCRLPRSAFSNILYLAVTAIMRNFAPSNKKYLVMKKVILLFAVTVALFSCEKPTEGLDPALPNPNAHDPIGDVVALVKQISVMKQTDAHTFLINQGWVGNTEGYEQVYTKVLDCGGKCEFAVDYVSDTYASVYIIDVEDIPDMPVENAVEALNSIGIEFEIRGVKQSYENPEMFVDDVAGIGHEKYGTSYFSWLDETKNNFTAIIVSYDTTTQKVTDISFELLLPEMDVDTLDVPYKFGFVEGECVVLSGDSVSQSDFLSQVAGSGWKWVSTNEIRLDGSVKGKEFWSGMAGAGPGAYFIDVDSVTTFYWSDARPGKCYHTDSTRFSNSVIEAYRQENWYNYMTLLEIKGDELWLMKIVGYRAADDRDIYVLEKYQRMADDELEFYRTNYIIEN